MDFYGAVIIYCGHHKYRYGVMTDSAPVPVMTE